MVGLFEHDTELLSSIKLREFFQYLSNHWNFHIGVCFMEVIKECAHLRVNLYPYNYMQTGQNLVMSFTVPQFLSFSSWAAIGIFTEEFVSWR